jgi:hypothetical protein
MKKTREVPTDRAPLWKKIVITLALLAGVGLWLMTDPRPRDDIHWQWASLWDEKASYESYLEAWPQGRHAVEASARCDNPEVRDIVQWSTRTRPAGFARPQPAASVVQPCGTSGR